MFHLLTQVWVWKPVMALFDTLMQTWLEELQTIIKNLASLEINIFAFLKDCYNLPL